MLIATDIAARGIDVDQVSHVVNYELPHEPETYVHRIGRTGRAGMTGEAVTFCDPEERSRLKAIEKLLRKPIRPRSDLPELPKGEASDATRPPRRDGGHDGHRDEGRRAGGAGRGGPRGSGQGRDGQRSSGIRHKRTPGGHTGGPQPHRAARRQSVAGPSGPKPDAGPAPTAGENKPKKKHRRAL